MRVTLPALPLEAIAPAVYAARREEIEAAQAAGWTFRLGRGSRDIFVAENANGGRRYAKSIPALLAQLTFTKPKENANV